MVEHTRSVIAHPSKHTTRTMQRTTAREIAASETNNTYDKDRRYDDDEHANGQTFGRDKRGRVLRRGATLRDATRRSA